MHHPDYPNLPYQYDRQLNPVYAGKTFRYDYEDGNVFIIDFFDRTHRHDLGVAGPLLNLTASHGERSLLFLSKKLPNSHRQLFSFS
ncbi:hypothetical protein [Brevibacillus centrosporus]|uniref:hypothetical protein n=1 Tax=Brevibacillus centrosporus TaxID=54910 RepID=UPI003986E432